jgi:hypothetical protein
MPAPSFVLRPLRTRSGFHTKRAAQMFGGDPAPEQEAALRLSRTSP